MSSINITIDQRVSDTITPEIKNKWLTSIIQESVKLLNKKESEIIIKIEKYMEADVINMPDILIRAETSISRRNLIKEWGELLLEITKNAVNEKTIRIAVKTYVIDSEWLDYTPPEKTS